MINKRILLVDDDNQFLFGIKLFLGEYFTEIDAISNEDGLPKTITQKSYDLVLLDMNLSIGSSSGQDGLFWLDKIKKSQPNVKIIIWTAYGEIELAVKAMKMGAEDFLTKPINCDLLLSKINGLFVEKKIVQNPKLKEDINKDKEAPISFSGKMKETLRLISSIASTDVNVLLLGENGVGKEVVAQYIHNQSLRADKSFVKVDLGAIPETLFESELFGYRKGAFTGALKNNIGRFEKAHKGTLFLDEIGNVPLHLQSKLLSVIQSKEVYPLGGDKPVLSDFRLISATNSPIEKMVDKEQFRKDLYYRINTIEVKIPPLRERKEDIPHLAECFVREFTEKYNKAFISISSNSMDLLLNYSWPGNVRELKHLMERGVILSTNNQIQIPKDWLRGLSFTNNSSLNINRVEEIAIKNAIDLANGNLTMAAKNLGMARATLYRKIQKYNLK